MGFALYLFEECRHFKRYLHVDAALFRVHQLYLASRARAHHGDVLERGAHTQFIDMILQMYNSQPLPRIRVTTGALRQLGEGLQACRLIVAQMGNILHAFPFVISDDIL